MPLLNDGIPYGLNLERLEDITRARPFTNIFLQARNPISQDGIGGPFDDGRPFTTDADGWITELAPAGAGLGPQSALYLLTNSAEENYQIGGETRWVCTYTGEDGPQHDWIEMLEDATVDEGTRSAGRFEFDVASSQAGIRLRIKELDPADPIKGIAVFPKIYEATYLTTDHFHPKFLETLAGVKTLRFTEWAQTRNSTVSSWAERTRPSNYSFAVDSGVPYEEMVKLCNKLVANAWVSIPHLADLDFGTQLGTLFRDTMNSGLGLYTEFSNEVWNPQFTQSQYCEDQGVIKYPHLTTFEATITWGSFRACEFFKVMAPLFAGQEERFLPVLGTQESNEWVGRKVMDAEITGPGDLAKDNAKILAGGTYFAHRIGTTPQADSVPQDHNTKITKDMTTQEIVDSIRVYMEEKVGPTGTIKQNFDNAQARGLEYVSYEGGHHAVATAANLRDDEAFTAQLLAAIAHPDMEEIYATFFAGWAAITGNSLFCGFIHTGEHTKWGSWGLRQYQDQPASESPMLRGFNTWLAGGGSPPVVSIPNVQQTGSGEQLQTESGEILETDAIFSFSLEVDPIATEGEMSRISKGPLRTESIVSEVEFVARMEAHVDLAIGARPTQVLPANRPVLQVDETGRKFIGRVLWQGEPKDISQAKVKKLVLVNPKGVEYQMRASFQTDGTDGLLFMVKDGSVPSAAGDWQIQAELDMPGFKGRTAVAWFSMEYNAS